MNIVKVASDSDGTSKFEDIKIKLVPKGKFGDFSDLLATKGFLFRESGIGYDSGWHPVPCPLYMVILEGEVEITVGSGECRKFGPGSVIYAVDTLGQGHRTRSLGASGFSSLRLDLIGDR